MAMTLDKAFDPRRNSIGFLRWGLAFAVIFSHAGPLAGFYGSKNLGTQWSDEQSFGGVAVAGFFFLSGFLITKSRMGRSTIFRYFWRRVLRIIPAFWAALLLTAFVLAPIAWWHSTGTIRGYFSAPRSRPSPTSRTTCSCACSRATSPAWARAFPWPTAAAPSGTAPRGPSSTSSRATCSSACSDCSASSATAGSPHWRSC